ncbi:MAG TPA: ABC transporter permease [Hydrogenophaga sp.]|uniref:FtsX-like permease family protein n=1 Tax=Hydrogenophaga sp. TaxID=1904254 RepID=UPI002C9960A8|nr:FtsX-like permease family protein [Hydrogenophaga sp.]HMN93098.1 ABC transporter permease [Hydrogenophaga sp.]HMP10944.1 ABC transporter permease [Hydrogenophaga sp.]
MNLVGLAWRYLWSRPLTSGLNLLLLTLGLSALGLVGLSRDAVDRALTRDLAGIDLVVGAKGSPMQLILAGVFHLDVPPGNIPLAEAKALARHPQVEQLIPLSLGDNLDGFRIVGTSHDYPAHYGVTLAAGRWWGASMEAVLGAQVARQTGLALGQAFYGAHGLGRGGMVHDDLAYQVTGILRPCGCVLDRLVLTATESVWDVHDEMHGAADMDEADLQALQAEREITLALLRYNTPLAAVTFPRMVNDSTGMQAAAPAVEVTRLMAMLGVGLQVLRGMGFVLLLVAGLSVFVGLWSALRERQADLALLRLLGAPPRRVAGVLLLEALWLGLLAAAIALLLIVALSAGLGWWLMQTQSVVLVIDTPWRVLWPLPFFAVLVAALSALVPVVTAYRQDVHHLLNSRS